MRPRTVSEGSATWPRWGACHGRAELFCDDGDQGSDRRRREFMARTLCGRCPVRAQCAAHALRWKEPQGIWGGFSATQRRRLLAVGWQDVADRRRSSVDVAALERRLREQRRPDQPDDYSSSELARQRR